MSHDALPRLKTSPDAADRRVARLAAALAPEALEAGARARLVARIEAAARAEAASPPRRPWLTWVAVPLAAGAVAALVLLVRPGTPPGSGSAGSDATTVAGGEAVLHAGPATRYRVERLAAETRVTLDAGELRAEVARHDAAHPFVVQTPRARVVVIGTAFTVSDDGKQTRVHVEHGVVRVEHGAERVVLHAGERWDSPDPAPTAPDAPPAASPPPQTRAPGTPPPETTSPPAPAHAHKAADEGKPAPAKPAPAAPAASTPEGAALADEERLLAEARRSLLEQGDAKGALVVLDEWAARHPDGSLEREALLLRIAAGGRAGTGATSAEAARRFLARYPDDPRAADVRRTLDTLCSGGHCP
jgi:hypothetical protein